ncbi:IS6 family transposase [Natrarchaeobaculum aegyptiacum]|uniref:IS6 family transposase n=1 Tax=Natrarchaeobaculum aegyptiacum TaxID=745377 RepID=A0A2Z2HU37_9EURY|nr:IS6 family transposase [Natrarchaeobaculum aegyptiacum]ARS90730.1 IS6 family transposase [Natrarchaeobaculum aegyptiacum]
MPETARPRGSSGLVDVEFVQRERTPRELITLGVRLHLGGLSLSNTVRELEKSGVERSRKAVHDWVHKADLAPVEGAEPATVALDETVIWIDGQQYWLYAAVDTATNRFLHIRLYSARTTAATEMFLAELMEKYDAEGALFLVDSAAWLNAALHRRALEFRCERHGDRNTTERVYREVKSRTSWFSNSSSHVNPATADSWLQAFARWHTETN